MTSFLADEDFNNDILRGLVRRVADLDVVRAQDVGLQGADDDAVLAAAAAQGRVVLTHDVSTLVARALARVRTGASMAGVIAVAQRVPIAVAIEDIALVAECGTAEDWRSQIIYLPLR
jgi:hypothetical protein